MIIFYVYVYKKALIYFLFFCMWATLLIMAAWMWSRYWWLKQIDSFGPSGETLLEYSIYDAMHAWFDHVVLVVRKEFQQEFHDKLWSRFSDNIRVDYVYQEVNPSVSWVDLVHREIPRGTGHAVLVAKEVIDQPFCVINADDYYGKDWFASMYTFLSKKASSKVCGMIGYVLNNTLSDHGTVNRWICELSDQATLVSVTEHLKIWRQKGWIVRDSEDIVIDDQAIVSMNFWWYDASFFPYLEKKFHQFLDENKGEQKKEFYIPAVTNDFIHESGHSCYVLVSNDAWYGVTYAADKEIVQEKISSLIERMVYPTPLFPV